MSESNFLDSNAISLYTENPQFAKATPEQQQAVLGGIFDEHVAPKFAGMQSVDLDDAKARYIRANTLSGSIDPNVAALYANNKRFISATPGQREKVLSSIFDEHKADILGGMDSDTLKHERKMFVAQNLTASDRDSLYGTGSKILDILKDAPRQVGTTLLRFGRDTAGRMLGQVPMEPGMSLDPEDAGPGKMIGADGKDLTDKSAAIQERDSRLRRTKYDGQTGALQNKYFDLTGAGESVGFGLASSAPAQIGGLVAGPLGAAVGAGLSAPVSFGSQSDSFLTDVISKVNDDRKAQGLPRMNQDEQDALTTKLGAAATKYGAWEAIPEMVSNAITGGVVGKLVHGVAGKTMLGKAAKSAGALALDLGSEHATETASQWGQGGLEAQAGLREKAPTLGEAWQEQAATTNALFGATHGAGLAGGKLAKSMGVLKDTRTETEKGGAVDMTGAVQDEQVALPPGSQPAISTTQLALPPGLQALPPGQTPALGPGLAGSPIAAGGERVFAGAIPVPANPGGIGLTGIMQQQALPEGAGAMPMPNQASGPAIPVAPSPGWAPAQENAPSGPAVEQPGIQQHLALPQNPGPSAGEMGFTPGSQVSVPWGSEPAQAMAPGSAAPAPMAAPLPTAKQAKAARAALKAEQVAAKAQEAQEVAKAAIEKANVNPELAPAAQDAVHAAQIAAADATVAHAEAVEQHQAAEQHIQDTAAAEQQAQVKQHQDAVKAEQKANAAALKDHAARIKAENAMTKAAESPTVQTQTKEVNNVGEGQASATGRAEEDLRHDPRGDWGVAHSEGAAGGSNGRTQGHVAVGLPTSVIHSDGEDAAHYEVREASSLIPSHDATRDFIKHEAYPENQQERAYHSDKKEQEKVLLQSRTLDPRQIISDNADTISGPPTIERNGEALGGNGRIQSIQHAFANNPEKAAGYVAHLKEKAAQYGVDPKSLEGFHEPVLVRVLDDEHTPEDKARLVRQYNQPLTQGLDVRAEGISRGRLISEHSMDVIGHALETHDSIRDYLSGNSSKELIKSLQDDGVLERTQMGRLTTEKTGLLNEEGKRLVENVLRGKALDDPELVSAMAPAMQQKIDRILGPLSILKAKGGQWDTTPELKRALWQHVKFQADGQSDMGTFWSQRSMFDHENTDKTNTTVEKLFFLMGKGTQKEVAAVFQKYAAAASASSKGQATLPGAAPATPGEAFTKNFTRSLAQDKEDGLAAAKKASNGQKLIGEHTGPGLGAAEVEAHVAEIGKDWAGMPETVVVQSEADLPDGAKTEDQQPGQVHGAYYEGKVYVVADGQESLGDVAHTVAHEVLRHHGLRLVLGDAYERTMKQAWSNPAVQAKAIELGQQGYGWTKESLAADPAQRMEATDEAIAHMGDAGIRGAWYDRALQAVQKWLRKIGLLKHFTNSDVRTLITGAENAARAGSGDGGNISGVLHMISDNGDLRERFNAVAPVELVGDEIADFSREVDVSALRKTMPQWAEEHGITGEFTNSETGWPIMVTRNSIKTTLSHGPGKSKIQTVAAIPGMLRDGVLVETRPSKTPKMTDHIFAAKASVDGETFVVGLVVREDVNGRRFYDHEMTEIKRIEGGPTQAGAASPEGKVGRPNTPRPSVMDIVSEKLGVKPSIRFLKRTSPNNPDGKTGEEALRAGIPHVDDAKGQATFTETLKRMGQNARGKEAPQLSALAKNLQQIYWAAKKHPVLKDLLQAQTDGEEARHAGLHDALDETYKAIKGLNDNEEAQLNQVAHGLDGKKLKGVTASKFLEKILPDGSSHMKLNEKHFEQMRDTLVNLKTKAGATMLSPKVVDAYIAIRRGLDSSLIQTFHQMQEFGVDANLIDKFRSHIGHIDNYVPHMRFGDHYINVTDEEGKTIYNEHVDASGPLGRARLAKAELRVEKAYPEAKAAGRITSAKIKTTPETVFENGINTANIAQIIEGALAKSSTPIEVQDAVRKEISKQVADILLSRGWGQHARERQNIPGYEMQNIGHILVSYHSGHQGWLHKIVKAQRFAEILSSIKAKDDPNLYAYAKKFSSDMLRNQDQTDRLVSKARTTMSVMYIAGRVSTAFNNLTQNLILGVPTLGQHVGFAGAAKNYVHQALRAVAYMGSGEASHAEHMKSGELAFLKDFHDRGITEANFMREIAGLDGDALDIGTQQVVSTLFLPFTTAERFNRVSLALASYRAARDGKITNKATLEKYGMARGAKFSEQDASDFAREVTLDSHFLTGKANLPEAVRGGARGVTTPMYTFMGYQHGLVSAWRNMLMNQGTAGKVAFAQSMAATIALGGLKAMPLFSLLSLAIASAGGGDDWERKLYKHLRESMGDKPADVSMYGIGALGDITLSPSMGMDIPILSELRADKPIGEQTSAKAIDLLGVPAALYKQIGRAAHFFNLGNTYRGVETLAPAFLAAPIRAYRLHEEGAESQSGRPQALPGTTEQYKMTDGEAALQALGFTPLSKQKLADANASVQNLEEQRKAKQEQLVSHYVQARKSGEQSAVDDVLEDQRSYNAQMREDGHGNLQILHLGKLAREHMKIQKPSKRMRGELRGANEAWGLQSE